MSKQYNKLIKRRRRKAYLKRRKAAAKAQSLAAERKKTAKAESQQQKQQLAALSQTAQTSPQQDTGASIPTAPETAAPKADLSNQESVVESNQTIASSSESADKPAPPSPEPPAQTPA